MSYARRTISYFKRNGIIPTFWAIAERKDKSGMDAWQKRTMSFDHEVTPAQFFAKENPKPEVFDEDENICFSILVPAYETDRTYFEQMIRSVRAQTYRNWQLVIADASSSEALGVIAGRFKDERISYVHLAVNDGISDNTNAASQYATGDYIGFLDHDDLLAPQALFEIARVIRQQDCDIVYTDEDKVSGDLKKRFEANCKPRFNLDLLLTNNYICHFTVMRRSLFSDLKLRHGYDGAQDYDLYLRALLGIEWKRTEDEQKEGTEDALPYGFFPTDYFRSRIGHVPLILYHWRAHEASTSDNPDSKRYAYEAGKRALEDFYRQLEWNVDVNHTRHLGFYETVYKPDLFSVRKDIWGVCGRKIKHGRVQQGPVLDGVKLFEGMNYHYSGYLHRAALPFDVDRAPADLILLRDENKAVTDNMKKKGRLLYLPDLTF